MKVKTATPVIGSQVDDVLLGNIIDLDQSLASYFTDTIVVDSCLTRKLVSFQSSKNRTHYRWYKYKEAFSADLVEYLFDKYKVKKGKIFDPFSGSGTALFASAALGYDAEGIELLPVGQKIIEANVIARSDHKLAIIERLRCWLSMATWNAPGETQDFGVLRITDGAYSDETSYKIKRPGGPCPSFWTWGVDDHSRNCMSIKLMQVTHRVAWVSLSLPVIMNN